MRKRRRKTSVLEFSKRLIIVVVSATLIFMTVCLVGMFLGKDVTEMFVSLCAILGGEVLTYSLKAFFGKYFEQKNILTKELENTNTEEEQ